MAQQKCLVTIVVAAVVAVVLWMVLRKRKEGFDARADFVGSGGAPQQYDVIWSRNSGEYDVNADKLPRFGDNSGQVSVLNPPGTLPRAVYNNVYDTQGAESALAAAQSCGYNNVGQVQGKGPADPQTYMTYHVHGLMFPRLKSRIREQGVNMFLGTPPNIAVPDTNWATAWFGLSGSKTAGNVSRGIFSSTVDAQQLSMDNRVGSYNQIVADCNKL